MIFVSKLNPKGLMKIAAFGSFIVPFQTKYMKAIVIGISTIKHQIRKGTSVTAAGTRNALFTASASIPAFIAVCKNSAVRQQAVWNDTNIIGAETHPKQNTLYILG